MTRGYGELMSVPSAFGRRGTVGVPPVDVLVALLVTALALVEIWVEPIFDTGIPGPRVPLTVIVVVSAVPLALRRRWPLWALMSYAACLVAVAFIGEPEQSAFELFLGLLLVVFSVAARETVRRAVVGAVVVVVAGGAFEALTYVEADTPADVAVPFLFLGAAWAIGREMRYQRGRAAQLVERAREAERSRIARELHDVVAHGVSVMGLQAAGVRVALSDNERPAQEALRAIEDTGRATLDELHRMLGVLRSTEAELLLSPAPRLARLADLFEDGGGGPRVRLSYDGTPRPLPAGLELSACRIIQEAVTNARRHSRAQEVSVEVGYGPEVLTLRIHDAGGGAPERWAEGHGVIGMRERAAVHGGAIEFANDPGHGFTVTATLPVGAR
jgi:signal transduction histidine kinase